MTSRPAKYAVIVGSEAGRPGDAMQGLDGSQSVSSARQAVATRISEVLRTASDDRPATEETLAGLRTEMAEEFDSQEMAITVLRGLLQAEDREERFGRVVRVWTGRVSKQLRDGEWGTGQQLLRAILDEPPYDASRETIVREALERVAGRETLRLVLDREYGSQPSEQAMKLISTLGSASVGPLVDMLAKEEDGQTRRLLTELLSHAARRDPHSLDRHLVGQPWFVLRNLATVLGKTGQLAATSGLHQMIKHDDHRVRIEALRGLVRVQRQDAAPTLVRMLDDPHDRVRQNAATLARSSESEELDSLLARELEADRLRPEIAVVVVRILASRQSAQARAVVETIAKQRFKVKGGSRAVRDAAREALEEARR